MASELNINTVIIALSVIVFITFSLFFNKPKKSETKGEIVRYAYMVGLATGNPKYKVPQKAALKIAIAAPECEGIKNILDRVYSNSKISFRYMGIPDFTPEQNVDNDELFFPSNSFSVPIQDRMEKYKEVATRLVATVCEKAILNAGINKADIAKVIVVSSTGFLGPSLDCALITELGLPRTCDRSLIGFMGCAAAMNGYRIAMDYARQHPGKLALLCCVEVSSVNTTFKDSVNDAIIHAIFADGCAACVIKADTPENIPKGTLVIYDEHSQLMAGTEDGITLSINDDGISCKLSKYLPQYIAKNMGGYVDAFLGKHKLTRSDMEFWAIHPGGRRIIEEAQNGLGVTEEQAADSWAVLDQYGNMLAPTVMFVLERIINRHKEALKRGEKGYNMGIAFSFSPGVGAEGILLRQL